MIGAGDGVVEKLHQDFVGSLAQRDGRVLIHPDQCLRLNVQRGTAQRAGPQLITHTDRRIQPLYTQPVAASGSAYFDAALPGNYSRNSRRAGGRDVFGEGG